MPSPVGPLLRSMQAQPHRENSLSRHGALQACSMRGEYDLYQSKYDAEGEHLEFKRHCCPNADCEADTIASPGTIGVGAPNISAANGVA